MLAQLYRDGGQTLTLGNPPIGLPLGRGIGGTTLVNSGTCFRTPTAVLERWARRIRARARPGRRSSRASSGWSGAVGRPGHARAGRRQRGGRASWRRAARLVARLLRRNARGCVGSGVCAYGCPTSAKQHAGITYVPRAERRRAPRSSPAPTCAGSTSATATRAGSRRGCRRRQAARVDAPTVVVAAGTVDTPVLLERNELGRGSRPARPQPLAASGDRRVRPHGRGRRHGARRAAEPLHRRVRRARGSCSRGSPGRRPTPRWRCRRGRRHAEAMADYRRLAQFGLMVSDSSRGRVRVVGRTAGDPLRPRRRRPRPVPSRPRTAAGAVRRPPARARSTAAAPRRPPGEGATQRPQADGVPPARHRSRRRARVAHGVVDGDLALHGVEGVYVADGSVVPSRSASTPRSRSWRSRRGSPSTCRP